ncbi:MAG: lysophospholipase [Pirellula sp.]|jgi:acylglycerol lipase
MQVHDMAMPAKTSRRNLPESGIMCRRWAGDSSPRFVVGIVHGLGEHAQRYEHVAKYFVDQGATVIAMDQRGHGRTGGSLPHFDTLVEDVKQLEGYLETSYPGIPIFLYGQSLGGSVVVNYILRNQNRLSGAIATSPLLRTASPPPAWKLMIAKLLGKAWPTLTLSTDINPKELSHDPAAAEAYQKDPIVHQRVSAALGLSMLEAGEWAIENAHQLTTPLLLMHGTGDRITSCPASREFASRSKDSCRWIEWPDLYHDMHWEPERIQLFECMQRFIDERIPQFAH